MNITATDFFAFAVAGGSFLVGGIQGFSGVDTANPIDIENGQSTASATAHDTPSVITTTANAMLVTSHTFASSSSWTPQAGLTEGFDRASGASNAAGQTIAGGFQLQAVAGASGAKRSTAAANADVGNTHIVALRRFIPNAPPTVNITSPAAGANFTAPASITLTASAADSDGTIQKVEFFRGGTTLIGTVTSAPYTFSWNSVAPGAYTLTAVATDNQNATTTSAPVNISVNGGPTVTLTSPSNGANFTAPATITLVAAAADADGTIQKVEFFHGGTNLIATVTTAPYSVSWTAVPQGAYVLTAVATDNFNATTTSTPVNITVARAPALHFIEVDHLNTPHLVSDSNLAVVWQWGQQEPFGVNVADENPTGLGAFDLPLRLPGQYFDKETNLHYNYFRNYDPSVGRYGESDPIGVKGGLNTYAYVRNNPVALSDPAGLVAWKGTFVSAAFVNRAGGGTFVFDLTSECKCSRRVKIQGIAVVGAVGFGVKAAGGSGGTSEFFDYRECPEEDVANGIAAMGSAAWVFGVGYNCTNDIQLGSLRSLAGCYGGAYGFDLSVGAYLGGSMVLHSSVECCSK